MIDEGTIFINPEIEDAKKWKLIIRDGDIQEEILASLENDENDDDIDTSFDTDYHLEAQEFMKLFDDNSVDVVLFDPPYSGRQVSECYKKLNKTVTMNDTNSGYFTKFKKEIARILKPNGICITCCWNTNGIGKKYGFEIIEILDAARGSMHNDTLVTVELKEK